MRDLARRVVLAKAMDGSHCWLSPPPPGDNAPLHHRQVLQCEDPEVASWFDNGELRTVQVTCTDV